MIMEEDYYNYPDPVVSGPYENEMFEALYYQVLAEKEMANKKHYFDRLEELEDFPLPNNQLGIVGLEKYDTRMSNEIESFSRNSNHPVLVPNEDGYPVYGYNPEDAETARKVRQISSGRVFPLSVIGGFASAGVAEIAIQIWQAGDVSDPYLGWLNFIAIAVGFGGHERIVDFFKDKRKALLNENKRIRRSSLQNWLSLQYGLEFTKEGLKPILDAIYSEDSYNSKVLYDKNKVAFKVYRSGNRCSISLMKDQKKVISKPDTRLPVEAADSYLEALTSVQADEAKTLLREIEEKRNLLSQQKLTTENQYIVSRSHEDIQEASQLLKKMVTIDRKDVDGTNFLLVLTTVNNELASVVKKIKSEVEQKLSVQANYVVSRTDEHRIELKK